MAQHPNHFNNPQDGMAKPDFFSSTAKDKLIAQAVQAKIRPIIENCFPDVDNLVQAIEAEGIPVIIDAPELSLKWAMVRSGAQVGFVPSSLPKYQDFVQALKKCMPEKAHQDFSKGVLITFKECSHFTFLAYQLYHALSFRNGLSGYSPRGIRLYAIFIQKYNGELDPSFLSKLGIEDSNLLKMAIRRDREALEFVKAIIHEVFIPLNNGKLLESGSAQA